MISKIVIRCLWIASATFGGILIGVIITLLSKISLLTAVLVLFIFGSTVIAVMRPERYQ